MLIIEIDHIDTEPPQARFARLGYMSAPGLPSGRRTLPNLVPIT
jgi:hypothetical protein